MINIDNNDGLIYHIKVDKSEGGFLGSSKSGGGGDESVTAKLSQQVLMMNNHLPILREMPSAMCVNTTT